MLGCAAPTANSSTESDLLIPLGSALATPLVKGALAVLVLDAALEPEGALAQLQGRDCSVARAAVQLTLGDHNADDVARALQGIDHKKLCGGGWAGDWRLRKFLRDGQYGELWATYTLVPNFLGSSRMLARYEHLRKATQGWNDAERLSLSRAVAYLFVRRIAARLDAAERSALLAELDVSKEGISKEGIGPAGKTTLTALLRPNEPPSRKEVTAYVALLQILSEKRKAALYSNKPSDTPITEEEIESLLQQSAAEESRRRQETNEPPQCVVWRAGPYPDDEAYFELRVRPWLGNLGELPAQLTCQALWEWKPTPFQTDQRNYCNSEEIERITEPCDCYVVEGAPANKDTKQAITDELDDTVFSATPPCKNTPGGEPEFPDIPDAA